jgi:hypothetical protein
MILSRNWARAGTNPQKARLPYSVSVGVGHTRLLARRRRFFGDFVPARARFDPTRTQGCGPDLSRSKDVATTTGGVQ